MELGAVDGRVESHFPKPLAVLQVPKDGLPALACRKQVPAAARPTQRGDVLRVPSQLARNAHGVQVPNDDGAIDATRGEVVPLAIEAHACRMARTDCVGNVLWVIL